MARGAIKETTMLIEPTETKIKSLNYKDYACLTQETKSSKVSDRYSFIPTSRPIETLMDAGWFVRSVDENFVSKADNDGFQKHMVRMRHSKDIGRLDVGDVISEILISNAHNGTSHYEIMASLYVCFCSNQCVTSDSLIASHKIKHIGYKDELVHAAVDNIVENAPLVSGRVKEFRNIELSEKERMAMARKALNLMYTKDRWKDTYFLDKSAKNALVALREKQKAPTLWNTFNILQEKIIKGDEFLVTRVKPDTVKKTKKVKSVNRNIFLNRGIWDIAEQVANKKNQN